MVLPPANEKRTQKPGKRRSNSAKPPKPSYGVNDLRHAFANAAKTPQAHEPGKIFGWAKHCTVPSIKLRDTNIELNSLQFRVEGRLEKAFFRQCEFEPDLEMIIAQPFIIDFGGWNGLLTYAPDFALYPKFSAPKLVEIKNSTALSHPHILEHVMARKSALAEYGVELCVETEKSIYIQPRRDNIEQLTTCLSRPAKELERCASRVREALDELGGKAHLFQLPDMPPRDLKWGVAFGLYKGLFHTDHNYRFGADFLIAVNRDDVQLLSNPCPYFNTRH